MYKYTTVLAGINYAILCHFVLCQCTCKIIEKSVMGESFVFCLVLWGSIHNAILNNLFSILHSGRSRELRLATDQCCNININININNTHVIKTVVFIIVIQVNRKCMMNELEGTELPMKVPHDAKMTVLIHVVFLIFFFCGHVVDNTNWETVMGFHPRSGHWNLQIPFINIIVKMLRKKCATKKFYFRNHHTRGFFPPIQKKRFHLDGHSTGVSHTGPKISPIFKKFNIHCTLLKGIKINL